MKDQIKKIPRWLIILLVLVSLLRIPTLFMPYSYGDETIYLTLGQGIRQNLTLYKDIHDNKPPLIYLLAAAADNLASFKAILAVWNLLTVFIFFKLSENLFSKNKDMVKVSTIIFALLTNLPLLEGNIVNSEILMIGPIMLSFLIAILKDKPKYLLLSGLIFSIAVLLKAPAIFDLPAIIFLWILSIKKIDNKEIKNIIKKTFYLSIGVLTPIFLTLIWYFAKGALSDYIKAAFLQNVGYLSSWRPDTKTLPFYIRNAPLLIRASVVLLGLILIYLTRKKINKNFAFISGWLLLSLFAATLSERPYPHYLVQTIPSISLLLGILFAGNDLAQSLAVIPLTLAFFVPVYFKFWYYPSFPFYKNFINLATGQITKREYLNHFGKEVERNYTIAKFIRETTSKKDRIFVWGDDAKVYALSRRLPPIKYVADYHIKDFWSKDEAQEKIIASRPKIVVIFPNSENLPKLESWLEVNYLKINLQEIKDGTRLYVLPSTKVASL